MVLNMAIELLIDLILSLIKENSAFLIIYFPLGVLMLVLSLTLVGIMPLLKHLRNTCDFESLPSYIQISPISDRFH